MKLSVACPSGATAVAASCGYSSSDTNLTQDANDIVINYVGVDLDNVNQAECRSNNTSSKDREIVLAATCAVPVADSSSISQSVLKICTYDPDTQQPCTEADATVYDPAAQKAEVLNQVAAANAIGNQPGDDSSLRPAGSAQPTTKPKKAKRQITLTFLSPR